MNKYYFTFGTDLAFPYGLNDFVEVAARTMREAECAFREKHPDRASGTLNCAFVYSESEFDQIRNRYYGNRNPIESLTAEGLALSDTDKAIVAFELSGAKNVSEYLSTLGEEDRRLFANAVGLPEEYEDEDTMEMA